MRSVHEFLKTSPFDIYELHLFHLVAEHRSFTKAAELAGLTQSAITRQMQGIEESLRVALFERTTRSVRLTPAGQMLRAESGRLLGDVDQVLRRIREDFAGAKKVIRVAVSRSVGWRICPDSFTPTCAACRRSATGFPTTPAAKSSRRSKTMKPISASSRRRHGCPRRCASRIGLPMGSRSSRRRTRRRIPISLPSVPGWTGVIDKTGCCSTNRGTPADGCAFG